MRLPFPLLLCREHEPLPDTGQWILLGLNERLPSWAVTLLRMRLIELHHYIMLFFILGFSVVFGCIKPPGMGLAARYCLTMGISRILRFLTFASTILPAVRPWCADGRFSATTVAYPHPWAQKYYVPYAKDHYMFRALLANDRCIGTSLYPMTVVHRCVTLSNYSGAQVRHSILSHWCIGTPL